MIRRNFSVVIHLRENKMVPWKMAQVENHPLTIRQEAVLTEPQQPYFLGHCETMPIL